jgi:hypothetical protein
VRAGRAGTASRRGSPRLRQQLVAFLTCAVAVGVGRQIARGRIGRPGGTNLALFQSFYTTKPNGTGMGLAISRSIIEAHGGDLVAAPNRPYGAVFQFVLPV